MNSEHAPCLLGLVTALGVVVGVFLPFVLVDRLAAVTYYGFAPVRMEVVGLLALVAVALLLAQLFGAVSPPVVAGALVVVGAVMLLNTAAWAWAVPSHVVMQLPVDDEFAYHRGALVLLSALVVASGLWYVVRVIPGDRTPTVP